MDSSKAETAFARKVSAYRSMYHAGLLSASQIAKFEAIPFWFWTAEEERDAAIRLAMFLRAAGQGIQGKSKSS